MCCVCVCVWTKSSGCEQNNEQAVTYVQPFSQDDWLSFSQAVIVIIIVVSVKCEQWHKSSENNKEFNWNKTDIGFYLVCNQRTHIHTFLK